MIAFYIILLALFVFLIVRISKHKLQKLEEKPKLRIVILCILYFFCFNLVVSSIGILTSSNSSKNNSTTPVVEDTTTETVYTTKNGMEIVLCDNGVAYVDGKSCTWTTSYVSLAGDSKKFIKVSLSLLDEYAIFQDKMYYGSDAQMAIKHCYPNGTPVTHIRR